MIKCQSNLLHNLSLTIYKVFIKTVIYVWSYNIVYVVLILWHGEWVSTYGHWLLATGIDKHNIITMGSNPVLHTNHIYFETLT